MDVGHALFNSNLYWQKLIHDEHECGQVGACGAIIGVHKNGSF